MANGDFLVVATSAYGPYKDEFLNCLSYPRGLAVWFSYRAFWIDQSILRDSRPAPRRGVIVFCDYPLGRPVEYHAVRFVTIEKIIKPPMDPKPTDHIGFKLVLDSFVSKAQAINWNAWIRNQTDHPPSPTMGVTTYFVFPSEQVILALPPSESVGWGAVAADLRGTTALRRSRFLHICGIGPAKKEPRENVPLVTIAKIPRLKLVAGRSYRLDFELNLPGTEAPFAAREVRVESPAASLSTSQPIILSTVGQNSTAMVVVNCERTYVDILSTLKVRAGGKDEVGMEPTFPVSVSAQRYLIIPVAFFVAFLLGIAAALSPDAVKDFIHQGLIYYNVDLAVTITKAACLGIAGLLALFVFQRLPISGFLGGG